MNKRGSMLGIVLILIGLFSLLDRVFYIDIFSIKNLWPLFILIPGLLFEWRFFTTRRDPGLLVPGGILTTIGTLFLFETFTNWNFSGFTWPIYTLSVAIGLFQLYIFGTREKGLLIPVFILTSISVISMLNMLFSHLFYWLNYKLLFPVILIGLGLFILFNESKR